MDLIYTNNSLREIGVLQNFELDLAYGKDENDFELVCKNKDSLLSEGFFIFIENTEYGGIIDGIKVDTSKNEIVYIGRTWQGILNSKILRSDNSAYFEVSGEANEILQLVINALCLNNLFKSSAKDSEIILPKYKFPRFIGGYDGLIHLCNKYDLKLVCRFAESYVELELKKAIDYTKDDQFDKSQVNFKITRNRLVNHFVVLGKGELQDRLVYDLYADDAGNISNTQFYKNLDEIVYIYENTSYDTVDELKEQAVSKFKELLNKNKINISFDSRAPNYDIGDIIGAVEYATKTSVRQKINKKIIKMTNENMSVDYKVGD